MSGATAPAPSRVAGLGLVLLVLAVVATAMEPATAVLLSSVLFGLSAVLVLAVAPDDLLVGTGFALLYANVGAIAVTRHGLPAVVALVVPALIAVPVLRGNVPLLPERRAWPRAVPWLVLYLLAMAVSSQLAMDRDASVTALVAFVTEGLLVYVLVVRVVTTPTRLRRMLAVLLGVGAMVAALAVAQTLTGRYDIDVFGLAQTSQAELDRLAADVWGRFDPPRAAGPIGEKNFFAQTLVVLVPVAVLLATRGRGLRRVVGAVCTALLLGGVAVTASRGAAVTLLFVLLAMLAARDLPVRHGLLAGVLVVALLAAFPAYRERLATLPGLGGTGVETALEDPAVLGRASSMLGSWQVFRDHPLVGVGPGNYALHHEAAATEVGLRVVEGREPHSLYLGLAAETGALGLAAFLGMAMATHVGLVRARRRVMAMAPEYLPDVVALQYALLAYMVSGLFLHLAYERYLWLWFALGGAAATIVLGERVPRRVR